MLPSLLPQPGALTGGGEHCLLALLHSPDDGFANGQRAVAQLIVGERKATYRSIKVAAFSGIHPGMVAHDMEENVTLTLRGKRRASTGEEIIYVRATDEAGTALDVGVLKVELCVIDEAGAAGRLQTLRYNRGWRSFWLRADELPRGAGGGVRVMAMVSGENRRARKTQLIQFEGAHASKRAEE